MFKRLILIVALALPFALFGQQPHCDSITAKQLKTADIVGISMTSVGAVGSHHLRPEGMGRRRALACHPHHRREWLGRRCCRLHNQDVGTDRHHLHDRGRQCPQHL